MKIKISPIIRMIPEVDRLTDVVDIEGVQTALVVRTFPTKEEAIANDGIILEEDFDVSGFLAERSQNEANALIQQAIDNAQNNVDKKLAKTLYNLTSFIKDRFLLNQTQIDQIQAMTTIAQIKNVILDRFSLTQGQQNYIEDFRTAYEEWINLKT